MIPCANPLAQYKKHRDAISQALQNVLDGGNYILGPQVKQFEEKFAAYCGVAHVVGVGSGTDALILTLRAMDIGAGDEVITVSHTALATIAAIAASGATPVVVDVDPVSYVMDAAALKSAITTKTKAVVVVHLYGLPADMDAIMAVARENGLKVIEDCAQATGARYKGRRVGSIGDAGCFSFYPTKNLGAIGDGGAVASDDPKLALRIERLRQYGWDDARSTNEPGLNSRLDELQAAVLNIKLPTLDADNAARRRIASEYRLGLAGLDIQLPVEPMESDHVYHLFVLSCSRRDWLKKQLAENGILAGVHYLVPGHLHPGYAQLCRFPSDGLPVTESLVGKILSLPMYPELSADDIERVVCVLRALYKIV